MECKVKLEALWIEAALRAFAGFGATGSELESLRRLALELSRSRFVEQQPREENGQGAAGAAGECFPAPVQARAPLQPLTDFPGTADELYWTRELAGAAAAGEDAGSARSPPRASRFLKMLQPSLQQSQPGNLGQDAAADEPKCEEAIPCPRWSSGFPGTAPAGSGVQAVAGGEAEGPSCFGFGWDGVVQSLNEPAAGFGQGQQLQWPGAVAGQGFSEQQAAEQRSGVPVDMGAAAQFTGAEEASDWGQWNNFQQHWEQPEFFQQIDWQYTDTADGCSWWPHNQSTELS